MKRREFITKSTQSLAALGLLPLSSCSPDRRVALQAKLAGNEATWTFVGSREWSEDAEEVLSSPVWNQSIVRGADDLIKREDFVYPLPTALGETDVSVEFQTFSPWWSLGSSGLVLRAQDSVRLYCVEISEREPAVEENKFDVCFFVQDETGYRRELGSAVVPHPPLPKGVTPVFKQPETYLKASHGWCKARVLVQGDRFKIFINDKPVLEVQDSTYATGRAGLVARGPNLFRNLTLSGTKAKLAQPWQVVAEERPRYFYPWPDPEKIYGDNQTRPSIFRLASGDVMIGLGVTGDPHWPEDVLLLRSSDEGKTWKDPMLVKKLADGGKAVCFYGHRDGRISCQYVYDWRSKTRAFSSDGGRTWTKPEPLLVSGRPIDKIAKVGGIGPYSPILRLADGTLLQCFFHLEGAGGAHGVTGPQRHRSLVIRSTDDGLMWTGPHYIDADNYESNDCMILERRDGSLIAFARAFERIMWKSISRDGGRTWTKQVPSTCPRVDHHYMLCHSSGVYLVASRGMGVFIHTSTDEGETWSRGTRISPCSGNTVMTELKDGRVLVVFQEAYRRPTRMRAQFMQVHPDGRVTAA